MMNHRASDSRNGDTAPGFAQYLQGGRLNGTAAASQGGENANPLHLLEV